MCPLWREGHRLSHFMWLQNTFIPFVCKDQIGICILAGENKGDCLSPEVKWSESRSVVSDSLWPPWTIQSTEFSRPEYWIPFSRVSSQPKDWTGVSCIAGRFFTKWAIREAPLERRNVLWNTRLEVDSFLEGGTNILFYFLNNLLKYIWLQCC